MAKCSPELKPKYIILAGGKAVETFFGTEKTKFLLKIYPFGRWRRLCISDPIWKAWVMPIIHPSFPQRMSDFRGLFQKDLKYAVSCLNLPAPEFPDEFADVTVTANLEQIIAYLKNIYENKLPFAYDFETNCLRPYFDEAKLYTVAISLDGQSAFSFPYQYPGVWSSKELAEIKFWMTAILASEDIDKIVLEEQWRGIGRVFFDEPKRLIWTSK